jgi:hypothetical protein
MFWSKDEVVFNDSELAKHEKRILENTKQLASVALANPKQKCQPLHRDVQ